jgi:hypothetical protein
VPQLRADQEQARRAGRLVGFGQHNAPVLVPFP